MPDWDAAVDALTDLRHAYRTEEGAEYTARFLVDWGEKRGYGDEHMHSFIPALLGSVDLAVPMWVSRDIVEMIDVASESFKPEPFYEEDLPGPHGFVLLEQPIVMLDAKDKPTSWRALTWVVAKTVSTDDFRAMKHWKTPAEYQQYVREIEAKHPGKPCVFVAMYSHADDNDYYNTANRTAGYPPMVVGGSRLSLMHFAPMIFGEDYEDIDERLRENLAPIQVFFRLAQQEIIQRSHERPSRHARKRAARRQQTIETAQVLRLRRVRRKGDEHDGDWEGINWTHRWLVGGHWRWQWYPSEERHKQIWIHPYVKGPDDKPLVAKDKVIDFSR